MLIVYLEFLILACTIYILAPLCFKPWDQLIARPCALAYIVVDDILGLARFRVKAEHKRYGISILCDLVPLHFGGEQNKVCGIGPAVFV